MPNHTVLVMRNKLFSFSGSDSSIKEANSGQVFFNVEGKAFSLRDKKTLLDYQNTPVVNIKEPPFSIPKRYSVYLGSDSSQKLFDIVVRFSLTAKMEVTFSNQTNGQAIQMGVKGDFMGRNAVIWADVGATGDKMNRQIVGKIYRPFGIEDHLFNAQTYHLEAAPGVDVALLAVICICLDDRADEQRNH